LTPEVLLDAGPLVAYLDRRDSHHEWAREQFAALRAPVLTNEPVLAEASHLLRKVHGAKSAVIAFVRSGGVVVPFRIKDHAAEVESLLRKYDSVPISLADACLVRMAELQPGSKVLTLDADFSVYRIHGRRVIPTIMPPRS
jgi:predicted nucleic acid-binding protein